MTFVEMLKKNLSARKYEQQQLMLKAFEGSSTKTYEDYLIAVGRFRQLKSDIDVILSQIKKRDPDGDTLDEPQESDDFEEEEEEEEETDAQRSRRQFSARKPKNWGGG